MAFSFDTIYWTLRKTAAHPLALVALLGYRVYEARGIPPLEGQPATTKAALALLALYACNWLSNRWRNGLWPQPRLNARTWPAEVVFVTGGAQGIGRQTCEILAAKGAKVAAVDIVEFTPSHPNIKAYKCDISQFDEITRAQAEIRKEWGSDVTMVANIAGLNNRSLILDLDERKVNRMIDVNLKSHFWTAIAFLPAMVKAGRGHFLSVASTMGLVGIVGQSDYVATKHGLIGMQESLYNEMQKKYRTPNVRTSVAIIGHTKTALFNDFDVGPVGRFFGPPLEPAHVAALIVDALEAQESRRIRTPVMTSSALALKALPSFVRDYLQWTLGGDRAHRGEPRPEQLPLRPARARSVLV